MIDKLIELERKLYIEGNPLHSSLVEVLDQLDELLADEFQNGHQAGYDEGFESGVLTGKDEGYDEGFESGVLTGKDEGYDDGYSDGFKDGVESVGKD